MEALNALAYCRAYLLGCAAYLSYRQPRRKLKQFKVQKMDLAALTDTDGILPHKRYNRRLSAPMQTTAKNHKNPLLWYQSESI